MSDEAEQAPAAVEEAAPTKEPTEEESVAEVKASEPSAETEATAAEDENKQASRKSVTFNSELTFDEAQAEISAIRSRAEKTRDSLRTSVTPPKPNYTSSTSSSSKSYSYESDAPKSKNMLSHLNSPSAMLNYKVQTARSLVRKQEDLLRNLARMRENMERSENEIGKASDFYTSGRYLPKRYDNYRTVSSARSQVHSSGPISPPVTRDEVDPRSDRAYSPVPAASISSLSLSSKPLPVTSTGFNDYEPDEDFEREMAAIRKRVADISRKANEVTKTKHSPYYDYEYLCDSPGVTSGLNGYDIYKVSEPSYEVKPSNVSTYSSLPASYSYYTPSAYTPSSTVSFIPASTTYSQTERLAPQSSYTEYVLDSLNEIPGGYAVPSDVYTSPSSYYDDLIPSAADLSVVY